MCQDAGLWPIVLLSTCMVNADHAPWDEAKWFQSGREAVVSYLSVAHFDDDPVFSELYPMILDNLGLSIGDGDAQLSAWGAIADAWRTKTEKVALTRWFGYIRTMRQFLTKWHSRLCTVLYMCASQGLLKTAAPQALASAVAQGDAGGEEPAFIRVCCFSLGLHGKRGGKSCMVGAGGAGRVASPQRRPRDTVLA